MKKCKIVVLFLLVVIMTSVLSSCGFQFTGKPNDYYGGNSGNNENKDPQDPESQIEEGDAAIAYGDYIIKSNCAGLFIIHTDNGELKTVASKTYKSIYPGDLLVYNNFLINVYSYSENKIVKTKALLIDLSTLTPDNYKFVIVKESDFHGNKAYTKLVNGVLYLSTYVYDFADTHLINMYKESGYLDNQFSSELKNLIFLCSINLNDMHVTAKIISGYFKELCQTQNAIYLVLESDGDRIIKLNNNFEVIASVFEQSYYINDRFSISDNGKNTMIVTYDFKLGTKLSIYDKDFNLVGQLTGIAPGENLKSVRYNTDYCYIVTYRRIDPVFKIDIRNPEKPVILSELKIDGFSTYLHLINEEGLAIGFQNSFGFISDISLFDVSSDEVRLINKIGMIDNTGLYNYDNRQIFVDRTRNKLIMLAFRNVTIADGEEAEESGSQMNLGIIVISYSQKGILIDKYIDIGLLGIVDEDYKNVVAITKLMKYSRCLIIGNYLYVVNDDTVYSYSIDNDYEKVSEFKFYEVSETA